MIAEFPCMLFLLVIFGFLNTESFSKPLSAEEVLPPDYDKDLPPKIKKDGVNFPVNVSVSLWVIQLRSINEAEMNFKMDVVVRERWEDYRLRFPLRTVNISHKVILDATWGDKIWTPDIWFKNALNTKLQSWILPSIFYWLLQNKTVFFSGRVTLDLSCDMKMHAYPHDSQSCGVSIMALMNPVQDLLLTWHSNPVRLSRLMTLPQFELGNITFSNCDTPLYSDMFSCIAAHFALSRRSGYFIINTYIPTVLIVTMSMLTFWIPPEAVPARITMGVTSLLTMITKQYQSNMPSVSYIVALNVWLSSCIAFVFCSLLEYAIVISLLKRKKYEVKPETSLENSDETSSITSGRRSKKGAWNQNSKIVPEKCAIDVVHLVDLISRVLFPVMFVLFCIIYANAYS